MDSQQHPYQFARDSLLCLRESLIELPANATAAETWVKPFSDMLNVVTAFGRDAGIDAYADPPVATLLEDVRSRLSKYATVTWIEHSPRVVAGMEERLRQIASTAALGITTPPADTTETGPEPSAFDVKKLIGEYARRVKEGSMSQAEFDKHLDSLLTPPSQTAPPIPTNSGGSVPSSSVAPRTSPAVVTNPPDVTVRPARNPVRHAAVASSSRVSKPAHSSRTGRKRARFAELMNTKTIPNYKRCESCTRSKVRCAPRIGSSPPYICARCEDAGRLCIRPAHGRYLLRHSVLIFMDWCQVASGARCSPRRGPGVHACVASRSPRPRRIRRGAHPRC